MDLMIIIVCLGVGTAAGMYISSQIASHIEGRTQDSDLLENMSKRDSAKDKGLWRDCGGKGN
jgi:hypothetical protein